MNGTFWFNACLVTRRLPRSNGLHGEDICRVTYTYVLHYAIYEFLRTETGVCPIGTEVRSSEALTTGIYLNVLNNERNSSTVDSRIEAQMAKKTAVFV